MGYAVEAARVAFPLDGFSPSRLPPGDDSKNPGACHCEDFVKARVTLRRNACASGKMIKTGGAGGSSVAGTGVMEYCYEGAPHYDFWAGHLRCPSHRLHSFLPRDQWGHPSCLAGQEAF